MSEARVKVVGSRIVVECDFHLKDAVKSVSGATWDPHGRCWTLPAHASTAVALLANLRGARARILADRSYRELVWAPLGNGVAPASGTGSSGPPVSGPIPFTHTRPWAHQVAAYWWLHDRPAAVLHAAMGTGKSKVVVDLVQNLRPRLTFIGCPNSVVDVWTEQFARHCAVPYRIISERKGTVAARSERSSELVELARSRGELPVLVVNHEASWLKGYADWLLAEPQLDLVVWDEIHRLKAPGGQLSRFAGRLGQRVGRRYGLTGTLMPHSPLDVYAEFRAIDQTVFGTSFARFRAHFAVTERRPFSPVPIVVGFQNEAELRGLIDRVALRIEADVLDLPEATHVERRCELEPAAMKIYASLERNFYAEVAAGEVTATNALVKLLRLRQITGGSLGGIQTPTGPAEAPQIVSTAKRGLLQDMLEDLPSAEPVVVFCYFHADLDSVHEAAAALGRGSCELSGRRKNLADWQRPAGPPILAVQVQSGGLGVDLTRARYCVYYSLGFSLGEYDQSLARVHRPGQKHPVTYIHLLAQGTVDEKVYKALQERRDVIEAVMNAKGDAHS